MMNKYLSISLIINAILGILYFGLFRQMQGFKDYSDLEHTLKMANIEMIYKNDDIANITKENLIKRNPALRVPVMEALYKLDSLHADFLGSLKIPFSISSYDSLLQGMINIHADGLKKSQKESKRSTEEIIKIIENTQHHALDSSILNHNLESLTDNGLSAANEALKQFVMSQKSLIFHDLFSISYRLRCGNLTRLPPLLSSSTLAVKKGEEFHGTLSIGMYTSDPAAGDKIFINGKQIPIRDSKSKIPAIIHSRPGKQQIEMVLEWMHPETELIKRDTNILEYWVIKN